MCTSSNPYIEFSYDVVIIELIVYWNVYRATTETQAEELDYFNSSWGGNSRVCLRCTFCPSVKVIDK
jgi:hypothetical protein